MNSFADLFRGSRLVSKSKNQIVQSSSIQTGDWGVKYTISPKIIKYDSRLNKKMLCFNDLETRKLDSANSRYNRVQRWKENFAPPKSSFSLPQINTTPASRIIHHMDDQILFPVAMLSKGIITEPLSTMSSDKYENVLEKAKTLSIQWQHLISKRIYSDHEWSTFLGVSEVGIVSNLLNGDGASFVHPPSYLSQDFIDNQKKLGNLPQEFNLPTVSSRRVKGRILNRVKNGFAIGIQGFVAFCQERDMDLIESSRRTSNFRGRVDKFDRNVLHDFIVLDARFDEMGRPEIVVSADIGEEVENRRVGKEDALGDLSGFFGTKVQKVDRRKSNEILSDWDDLKNLLK